MNQHALARESEIGQLGPTPSERLADQALSVAAFEEPLLLATWQEREIFTARFALELASRRIEPGSPVNTPTFDAFLLEHALSAVESGQELAFHFRRAPAADGGLASQFAIFGQGAASQKGVAETSASDLGHAIRRILSARSDCGFSPVMPSSSALPFAYRVEVEGMLLCDQVKPSRLEKAGSPIVLPALSLIEARVPFFNALASTTFPVEVNVAFSAVSLSQQEIVALGCALEAIKDGKPQVAILPGRQWLTPSQVRLLAQDFARELSRWLAIPTGVQIAIGLRTLAPMSPGSLRWLAQALLPTRRISVVTADSPETPCAGAVDLRFCFNQARVMPEILPDRETVARLNLPLRFPPPAGLVLPDSGLVLGTIGGREVRLSERDRDRHCYLVGATGCGKSALLRSVVLQDIARGEGLALLDPHGDLFREVLDATPQNRLDDVVVIDPTDFDRAPGLNFLETPGVHPALERSFVTNELMKILDRLYDLKQVGGPLFETYLRNSLLLLMESRISGATLLEVPALFEDESFRAAALRACTNPAVVSFWRNQAESAGGEAKLENIAPYIASKLNQFATNALLRPIVGQSKSTINFQEAMDSRRIVLVNLSKGLLGEYDSSLLGMLVVGKIFSAALARGRSPKESRQRFHLVVDEFQNFTSDTIAHLLAEARKFGLRCTFANQVLRQIDVGKNSGNLCAAVLGNVANILTMRVGGDDVEVLRGALGGGITSQTLRTLPDYHVGARLMHEGKPQPAFVFETLPPAASPVRGPKTHHELALRERYTRPIAEVERELADRPANWIAASRR